MSNKVLSPEEASWLHSWIRKSSRLFCSNYLESLMLHFICDRTIHFKGLSERILSRHFEEGIASPKYFHAGCGLSRKSVFNTKRALCDKGIIFLSDNSHYVINVSGIVKVLIKDFSGAMSDKDLKILSHVSELFDEEFPELSGKEVKVVHEVHTRMVETLKEREEKDRIRKDREKKKIQTKKSDEVKVNDIFAILKEACSDYGLTFFDEWTGKTRGQAKNWLKYCKQHGLHPRTLLQDVVRLWSHFYERELFRLEDGSPISLHKVVSFSEFFIYRKEIALWIEANKNEVYDHEDPYAKFKNPVWEKVELKVEPIKRKGESK
jgi:hypothetical protein